MTQRAAFASTVTKLMEADDKIVTLLGDIGVFSFKSAMERWPDRCLNAGVAEQGMVGMAAGLAMSGLYPIISTIDAFLVRRAYEFIRLDFAEQQMKGLFVSVGHDSDYTKLGPTHWCHEAKLLLHSIPLLSIGEPASPAEAARMIETAVYGRKFAYIRLRG